MKFTEVLSEKCFAIALLIEKGRFALLASSAKI